MLLLLPVRAQEKRLSLLFVGDAMQHIPQINGARGVDGSFHYDSCFYLLKEKIHKADLAGLNFETTLGGKPYSGYPLFSAPDAFATALRDAGFNLFFLANNHAADRGNKGIIRTIKVLDSIGVRHTGTFVDSEKRSLYYPLMVIKNGIRIAFLNYTYSTNGMPVKEPCIVNLIDRRQILNDLHLTRLYNPDIIIAQLHWGEEYSTIPSLQQKQVTSLLQQNGVQIIIGHHPHVIQPIKIERDQHEIKNVVYYSLGNFISNQQRRLTDGGMIAEIVISKESDEAPISIESCDYSLVWVEKAANKRKIKYRLIPWPNDSSFTMTEGHAKQMNNFVNRATYIINNSN